MAVDFSCVSQAVTVVRVFLTPLVHRGYSCLFSSHLSVFHVAQDLLQEACTQRAGIALAKVWNTFLFTKKWLPVAVQVTKYQVTLWQPAEGLSGCF